MNVFAHSRPAASVVGSLLLAAAGCGGSAEPWQRIPVAGSIALPNASAAEVEGTISFAPDGVEGPGAVTKVTAGKFQFDRTNGPVAGPHQVILQLNRPSSWPKPITNAPLNPKTDPNLRAACDYLPQQRLPATVPAAAPFRLQLTAASETTP